MRISLFCVLVVSVACSSFQTSAAENPNAEYCVLVASFNDQRLTMRDQFDAWAQMQKLNVEMVDPQLSVYRDAANSYAINLRINLGRRGVLVALAPKGAGAAAGKDALEKFLASDIAPRWNLTPCTSAEGFKAPPLVP
jgi:hypothetical protein